MTWLARVQALRKGQSLRVEHCVPGDMSAVASAGDRGYGLYCFRCGGTVEFVPYPEENLKEKLARLAEQRGHDTAYQQYQSPPAPANLQVRDWPVERRAWLHKAGLSNDDIAVLGIYYHEVTDRIVLPVVQGGEVIYWQARGFDKSRAKYLNPKVGEPPVVEFGTGQHVVLVEDYLSAFRVGQVTTAWGLLGTALKVRGLVRLLHEPRPVLTWFDPDTAGRQKAAAVRKQLRAYGRHVVDVASTRDPKLHSAEEISVYIGEASGKT